MISEKKNTPQNDFGGKTSCKEIPGEKNPTQKKNIFDMAYNAGKKSYTVVCQENKLYYQDPVPERPISFNRGLKILFHFLYLLSSSLLRKTFCVIITESHGKTQLVCKLEGHVLTQENLA